MQLCTLKNYIGLFSTIAISFEKYFLLPKSIQILANISPNDALLLMLKAIWQTSHLFIILHRDRDFHIKYFVCNNVLKQRYFGRFLFWFLNLVTHNDNSPCTHALRWDIHFTPLSLPERYNSWLSSGSSITNYPQWAQITNLAPLHFY